MGVNKFRLATIGINILLIVSTASGIAPKGGFIFSIALSVLYKISLTPVTTLVGTPTPTGAPKGIGPVNSAIIEIAISKDVIIIFKVSPKFCKVVKGAVRVFKVPFITFTVCIIPFKEDSIASKTPTIWTLWGSGIGGVKSFAVFKTSGESKLEGNIPPFNISLVENGNSIGTCFSTWVAIMSIALSLRAATNKSILMPFLAALTTKRDINLSNAIT